MSYDDSTVYYTACGWACSNDMYDRLNGQDELYKDNSDMGKSHISDENHKLDLDNNKVSEVTKLIAGLGSKEQIQNKTIKKLYHDSLDYMIYQYAKKESLPIEHIKVAQQQNCLEILIKGFLKKVGGFVLTKENVDEINCLIEDIYRNDGLEIVYERVALIQKFIHKKIGTKYGKDAYLNLPVKHIRNLLSASRLHLNICDIKYKDINSLTYLIDKSREAFFFEWDNPKIISLPKGKNNIKNWRVRHMKSLVHFNLPDLAYKINQISHMDKNIEIEEFKQLVINIYSTT